MNEHTQYMTLRAIGSRMAQSLLGLALSRTREISPETLANFERMANDWLSAYHGKPFNTDEALAYVKASGDAALIDAVANGRMSIQEAAAKVREGASASPDLSGLTRFDVQPCFTIGGYSDMRSSKDGDYFRVADVQSLLTTKSVAAQPQPWSGELPELVLPAALEIDWPQLNSHALGCGVEDRNIRDRYDAANYGFEDGVDKAAQCVPEQIYDADTVREIAEAYARQAIASAVAGVREKALKDAEEACEKVQDECRERNSGKYPELQESADMGAGECLAAIRSLQNNQ